MLVERISEQLLLRWSVAATRGPGHLHVPQEGEGGGLGVPGGRHVVAPGVNSDAGAGGRRVRFR